jgi:hypothetical protein
MASFRPVPLSSAILFMLMQLAGCGGRAETPGSGGTTSGGIEAGTFDTGTREVDSGLCVTLDPSHYDQSCQTETDCIAVYAGQLCDGYSCFCSLGGTINMSAEASYQMTLSTIHAGTGLGCGCPVSPQPQCLAGTCTICAGLPSDPSPCHTTPPDAGQTGSACVDVDLSTYDRSCQSSSDCVDITPGVICPGSCTCGGAAVNASEQLRYQNTIDQLGTSSACPCAAGGELACIANQCTLCGLGNQPACPDGG